VCLAVIGICGPLVENLERLSGTSSIWFHNTTSAPRFVNRLQVTLYCTLSCVRIVPRSMNS